ncbi:MAG: hypothetical protein J5J04_16605 [Anaerolineae bacterium]|nr:hypothetical protein [Anaerolineae bacterium]
MSDIVERLRQRTADYVEHICSRPADHEALEAADEIERLRAEVVRLTAEQDAVSAAIGTNEYMDPPDGGNVSLAEQVRRMRDALLARAEAAEKDAARYRTWRTLWTNATAHVAAIEVIAEAATEAQLDAAVDAAIAQKEGM